MRVLHVLDHSIPLHSGYSFRTLAILEQQRLRGWETIHLTTPKHHLPVPPKEEVDGWTFYRTPDPPSFLAGFPGGSEVALVRGVARRLAEVAGETRPDLLHAHSPVLNALPTLWVARRLRLPVVYEVRAFWEDAAVSHGTGRPEDLRYRLGRALETFALRRSNAVTTICEGLRRDIIRRGIAPEKVTVIPNAVDAAHFSGPQPPDKDLAERLGVAGRVVLGFFGSFYRYEGLHTLLRAVPALAEKNPAIRILLVGGGFEAKNLKQDAAQLGIADKVVFVGRVPHGDIQKYYDLADILIYPRISIRLTELVTPLKPLEAMAQERIVLASDIGGHRELIRNDVTGYLFPPDDPAALAARVLDVLDRRADWPATRARALAFVRNERSWPISVARYEQVYARALSSVRGGAAEPIMSGSA